MNKNFELEIAGRLYEQMFATLAKTDGRLMEFESFIVRHYAHDGTTLIREISERHSAGPVIFVETPKQGRSLRQFVHPESKNRPGAQSNPTLTNTTRKTAAVQPDADQVAQSDTIPGGENPPLTLNESPAVAVDGGTDHNATTDNVTPITMGELTIDPIDAKTMKAAAFGKKYGIAPLRKFLEQQAVKYDGNPSVTQLAQLTIQIINGKK